MGVETDKQQASDKWSSIFFCWAVWWLIQVSANTAGPKQAGSAETLFSCQNSMSTDLMSSKANKYQGVTVWELTTLGPFLLQFTNND